MQHPEVAEGRGRAAAALRPRQHRAPAHEDSAQAGAAASENNIQTTARSFRQPRATVHETFSYSAGEGKSRKSSKEKQHSKAQAKEEASWLILLQCQRKFTLYKYRRSSNQVSIPCTHCEYKEMQMSSDTHKINTEMPK